MRFVRKYTSIIRRAQEDEPATPKPTEVLPTDPRKLKYYPPGKKPRYEPKREYPTAEEPRTIDLTQELAQTVRTHLTELINTILDNVQKVEELKNRISNREKKLLEMDRYLKKLRKEQRTILEALLTEVKQLFERMEQYKAEAFKYKDEADEIVQLAIRLAEVPTGRITQAGVKRLLELIEEETGQQFTEQQKQRYLIEAMGTQLSVIMEQIEREVEELRNVEPEENETTTASFSVRAINWRAIMEALKSLVNKVISYIRGLSDKLSMGISKLRRGRENLEEVKREMEKMVE